MSVIIVALVAMFFLAGLIAMTVAIMSPRFRVAALAVAVLAIASAAAGVGTFVLIVSRMR